jgi:hypothetical protein
MAEEVFMDIPEVEKVSSSFGTFADILQGIGVALKALSITLHATAWLSLGASEAQAQFIDRILPNIENAQKKMEELSGDISSAIQMYQTGDTDGSRRFC